MYTVLLVIHTLLILFMIGFILLQRADSDGLSGLGGGGGNLFSGRAAGNVLTHTTAILATCFIITSLVLAVMTGRIAGRSIVNAPAQTQSAPSELLPDIPRPE